MKAILTAVVMAMMMTQAAAALKPGDALPVADRQMKNVDGATTTIKEVVGEKGTLVVFTCNHCPFVVAWQDRMVELAKRCQKESIGVVFINSNSPAVKAADGFQGMQALAKNKGYTFPYVVDEGSVAAKKFGATRTPEVFLFDAENKLVYHGAVDDDARRPDRVKERWLSDAITALLAGEKPVLQETKSIGCSIKFY